MLRSDTWVAHGAIHCNCLRDGRLKMLRIFNQIGDVSIQVFLSWKAVKMGMSH